MKKETLKAFVIVLLIVVSIETIIIVFLGIALARQAIYLGVYTQPVIEEDAMYSLEEAIKLGVSLAYFEKLVTNNIDLINVKTENLNDPNNIPILAVYATPAYTNYLKVLIKNGADVEYAINWHKLYGREKNVKLLEAVDKEVKARQ